MKYHLFSYVHTYDIKMIGLFHVTYRVCVISTLQHTATNGNTLHHTATHCNTLQCIATHLDAASVEARVRDQPRGLLIYRVVATQYNTLQHPTTHYSTLQYTATHGNALQHTLMPREWKNEFVRRVRDQLHGLFTSATNPATPYNNLQHTATHCNTLQHTATHCNTLQHHTANLYSAVEAQVREQIREQPQNFLII